MLSKEEKAKLRTIVDIWKKHFSGELPQSWALVLWTKKYSVEGYEAAIKITETWLNKVGGRPVNQVASYCSAVMRNRLEDKQLVEDALKNSDSDILLSKRREDHAS